MGFLAACDQGAGLLGGGGAANAPKNEASREADGKAVGGGCRHAGRAIEDCYALYNNMSKGAIFAGWREMDAYMREHSIEAISPTLPPPPPSDLAIPNKKKKSDASSE